MSEQSPGSRVEGREPEACEWRYPLADGRRAFCRHAAHHSRGNLVTAQACAACPLHSRLQPASAAQPELRDVPSPAELVELAGWVDGLLPPPRRKAARRRRPRLLTFELLPCAHRGATVGQAKCDLCGARNQSMPVAECRLYGECVPTRASGSTAKRCDRCDGRNDRQPLVNFRGDPDARIAELVTVGVTTFDRPAHLARCITSLRELYPAVRVIVGDNGTARAKLPPGVELLDLPHDCGLSTARNALVAACRTRYLLIAEDDFVFRPSASIQSLQEVLEHDPAVAVVGGGVVEGATLRPGAFDFIDADGELRAEPATAMPQQTSAGTLYRRCHKVANFLLLRPEVARAHPWPEELKVGEHAPWFWLLREAGVGVAHVPAVAIEHDKSNRTSQYKAYRGRARELMAQWFAERGLRFSQASYHLSYNAANRPNIVILGVGHSGTTVLARMLGALGWSLAETDEDYAEPPKVRELNTEAKRSGQLDTSAYRALPRATPWVVKDPRFVWTLDLWRPHFTRAGEQGRRC